MGHLARMQTYLVCLLILQGTCYYHHYYHQKSQTTGISREQKYRIGDEILCFQQFGK